MESDGLTISLFSDIRVQWTISDLMWHHICFIWTSATGQWSLFVDGNVLKDDSNYGQDKILPKRCVEFNNFFNQRIMIIMKYTGDYHSYHHHKFLPFACIGVSLCLHEILRIMKILCIVVFCFIGFL